MTEYLWTEDLIRDLDIEVPPWIDQDINASTVSAIVQGGCDSGAYMPAVTYWQANETMAEHGDAVLDYLQQNTEALSDHALTLTEDDSWSGFACRVFSCAVEYWAIEALDLAIQASENAEDEDDEGQGPEPKEAEGYSRRHLMGDAGPGENAAYRSAMRDAGRGHLLP